MALLDNIGNAFSSFGAPILDGIASYGNIFTPYGVGGGNIGQGSLLRYPSNLSASAGMQQFANQDKPVDKIFEFNTSSAFDTIFKGSDSGLDPYIMFQLYKPEMSYDNADMSLEKNKQYTIPEVAVEGVKNLAKGAETLQTDAAHRKSGKLTYTPQANIALYMTPNINISDAMHYETGSRAAAAFAQDYYGKNKVFDSDTVTDVNMLINQSLSSVLAAGGAAGFGGLAGDGMISNALKFMATPAAVAAKVTGDEGKRLSGKVYNPNEYLQFKNSQLRTFDFSFKFLPNSLHESNMAAAIIKTFRVAMRPKKLTALTMEAPFQVQTTFYGTEMPNVGPSYITQASVTYNPNSASFFKHGGAPVEIDFNLQISEIYPLYRQDIEGTGPAVLGKSGVNPAFPQGNMATGHKYSRGGL